jgi:hypothetical protein
MFKIFRKIRQGLLVENKFSKYVVYALGEIFLVVIGILIALQINNWNQNRLERVEEKKLLTNIKVDYQEAINTFELLNKRRDEALQNYQTLFNLLGTDSFGDKWYIDSLLCKTIFTPTYNGKSSSLSVLINTGKINLLSNDTLKSMLFSWPQRVEDMTEGEIDAKDITVNGLTPLIGSYVSYNDMFRSIKIPNYEMPFVNRKSKIEKNYKALFSDPEFENYISQMDFMYEVGKRETHGLITLAKQIIAAIDRDLDK